MCFLPTVFCAQDGSIGEIAFRTYFLYIGCAGGADVGAVAGALVGGAAAAGMNQAPHESSEW